jgi:L-alanine-DL-glutamate epimerase-like enolase superfamily enzyme
MSLYDRLGGLALEVEAYELEGRVLDVSSEFTRKTTIIRLYGGGHEGVGEDVSYDAVEHEALQGQGPVHPLAGTHTLRSFGDLVAQLDLFPQPPVREVYRLYRRWAFDSAALDLALRQAGLPLHEAVAREPRPMTFVVSLRLGEPPSMDPIRRRLDRYPTLRFKLDPTSSWSDALIDELRATGAVDSVDFKGLYKGTVVDQPPDPDLYRRVVQAFPDAWIEDPALTPEIDALLAAHRDRITWDAPIHSVADIEALPFPPRMINLKPSRLGGLRSLCEAYEYCAECGIEAYGGGQFELGPGRGQIQYLASIFHPETPNDVAPGGYNLPEPGPGLPSSPMPPVPSETGFGWEA